MARATHGNSGRYQPMETAEGNWGTRASWPKMKPPGEVDSGLVAMSTLVARRMVANEVMAKGWGRSCSGYYRSGTRGWGKYCPDYCRSRFRGWHTRGPEG